MVLFDLACLGSKPQREVRLEMESSSLSSHHANVHNTREGGTGEGVGGWGGDRDGHSQSGAIVVIVINIITKRTGTFAGHQNASELEEQTPPPPHSHLYFLMTRNPRRLL